MPIEQGGSPANPDPSTETKQDDIIAELQIGTDRWFVEVANGNVDGWVRRGVGGFNDDIDAGSEENIYQVGGIVPDLTSNTTLYISSANASDDKIIIVDALVNDNGSWNRVNRFATLNGQNQVALNGDVIFVYSAFTTSATNPAGDVYVSEEATGGDLVNGVPQTNSKIKCVISAGDGAGFSGKYATPSGVKSYFAQLQLNVDKAKDVRFWFRVKLEGFDYQTPFPFRGYEQIPEYFKKGFFLTEKTIYDFTAESNDDNTGVTFANFVYEQTL